MSKAAVKKHVVFDIHKRDNQLSGKARYTVIVAKQSTFCNTYHAVVSERITDCPMLKISNNSHASKVVPVVNVDLLMVTSERVLSSVSLINQYICTDDMTCLSFV